MKTMKLVLKTILAIGLASSMMACSKKKDSQPSFANRYNRGYVNNGNQSPVYPGGDPYYSQNCPGCGYVYNGQYDMTNVLYDFLNLNSYQDEIGFTSGQMYQNTGVIFRGQVDAYGRNGEVKIYIWDQIAEQTGEAYQVSLQLVSGQVDNQRAQLVFQDNTGTVTFNGTFNNDSTYRGTVTYDNGRGVQTLGQFITGSCDFVLCQ